MNDLISRQDALNALGEELLVWNEHNEEWELGKNKQWHEDVEAIKSVPSAQPEKRTEKCTETHACDLISRQAAIDAVRELFKKNATVAIRAMYEIERLPSAHPEQHHDEWCTDCKEYDQTKHCCPRFNRVIRTAMADASRWIPCSERLPEERKDVLISADSWLYIAHLEIIDGEECWTEIIESLYIHDVDAWMPLPEPYEPEE